MNNQIYINAKQQIADAANELKETAKNDRPLRRQTLNDLLDALTREINLDVLRERLTQKRADLYINWLTNYTIKRHSA